jgi:hypothetical protein
VSIPFGERISYEAMSDLLQATSKLVRAPQRKDRVLFTELDRVREDLNRIVCSAGSE